MLCAVLPLTLRLCRDRIAAVRAAAAAQAGALLARLARLADPDDTPAYPFARAHADGVSIPRPHTPNPAAAAAVEAAAGSAAHGEAPPAGAGSAAGDRSAANALGRERSCSGAGAAGPTVAHDIGDNGSVSGIRQGSNGMAEGPAGAAAEAKAAAARQAAVEEDRWAGFDAGGYFVERLGELKGERCHQLRLTFLGACASALGALASYPTCPQAACPSRYLQ